MLFVRSWLLILHYVILGRYGFSLDGGRNLAPKFQIMTNIQIWLYFVATIKQVVEDISVLYYLFQSTLVYLRSKHKGNLMQT